MRAIQLGIFMTGSLLAASTTALAQNVLPPPAANTGDTSGAPGATPAPAAAQPGAQPTPPVVEALPPPVAGGPSNGGDSGTVTGTPAPSAVPPAPNPEDWRFSWHGYFRAPMRIGVGSRQACPAGATAPQPVTSTQFPSTGMSYNGPYCAMPGQAHTTFHSPYVPDDQYLAWTNDRQWEQAWTEIFLSYGNNHVVGTVGLQGYDFTDVSMLGDQANPAQFGVGQGWVTLTPDLPVDGLGLTWKVGAFWEKFGQAGKYDAGHYDTYMFGRTHLMGEALKLQYALDDVTLKVEHGFGVHLEMSPAGIPVNGSPSALPTFNPGADNNIGGGPGYTLADHVHAGVSFGKWLDINAHYMVAWEQDDREEGTGEGPTTAGVVMNAGPAYPVEPSGSISVYGAEARFTGGVFGEAYVAYSHIQAKNVTTVGPAIEVVHSLGGGGHNAANGIYENFFNGVGDGNGNIDTVQIEYDFSFGYLWRRLHNAHATFWGDGPDVRVALFGMYSVVSGTDSTSINLITGTPTDGTQKLKYGVDLVASLLPWLSVGARGDYVQPDSHDVHESFGVLSPKIMIHSKFITHEEITLQYSHYWDGADVLPQQWLSLVGEKNIASATTQAMFGTMYPNYAGTPYPNDANVFGIKATMWW